MHAEQVAERREDDLSALCSRVQDIYVLVVRAFAPLLQLLVRWCSES